MVHIHRTKRIGWGIVDHKLSMSQQYVMLLFIKRSTREGRINKGTTWTGCKGQGLTLWHLAGTNCNLGWSYGFCVLCVGMEDKVEGNHEKWQVQNSTPEAQTWPRTKITQEAHRQLRTETSQSCHLNHEYQLWSQPRGFILACSLSMQPRLSYKKWIVGCFILERRYYMCENDYCEITLANCPSCFLDRNMMELLYTDIMKIWGELGMVAHIFNASTQEAGRALNPRPAGLQMHSRPARGT